MDFGLAGKVAIVTGGSQGIGLGMATAFAKNAIAVAITARTESTLQSAVQTIQQLPGAQAIGIRADGTDEDAVMDAVDRVVSEYGRIDILVNCAQTVVVNVPLQEHTMDDFMANYASGVFASFLYMKHTFTHLRDSRGTVVNFGSHSGMKGTRGMAAYGSNKEAIRGLTRVAAREWGQYGITVNAIVPAVDSHGMDKERYEGVIRQIPVGRMADGEIDCGGLAMYLATPGGKIFTGDSFNVDGGMQIRP